MDFEAQGIRRMSQLDRLPWFRTGEYGLQLREDSGVPPVLDVHAHVGWSFGFARSVEYTSRPPVKYFYDYEEAQDVLFDEHHPFPKETEIIGAEMRLSLFKLGESSATHTASNLIGEGALYNYSKICLLPIEGPIASRHAKDTMAASKLDSKFIPFAAVHPWPWGTEKVRALKALLDQGAPAVKYHPEFQFIAPDNPHMRQMFAWCESHGVPILAHCGYTGAEPGWLRAKAEPDQFRAVLRDFPKLKLLLAHTGLSRWEQTLDVVQGHDEHAWIDISGQPANVIRTILDRYDHQRICYGSDWPFYPIAVAMARPLVATHDRPDLWPDLFYNNAARFLGMPSL